MCSRALFSRPVRPRYEISWPTTHGQSEGLDVGEHGTPREDGYQSGGPSDRPDVSTSPYQSATYLLESCSTRCPWATVETVLPIVLVWLQEVIDSARFYLVHT